jgi:hypothetical protein
MKGAGSRVRKSRVLARRSFAVPPWFVDASVLFQASRPWMAAAGMGLYAGVGCLCVAARSGAARRGAARNARWWGLLAGCQGFLAADAAFGIRMILAGAGRSVVQEHGWYESRAIVQAMLLAGVSAMAVLAGIVVRRIRGLPRETRWAAGAALVSLLMFAVSVISMHKLEGLLAWPFEPLALRTSVRGAACLVTAAASVMSLRRKSRLAPAAEPASPPRAGR